MLRVSDRSADGAGRADEEVVVADLADAAAVHALLDGVDAVIHLGGVSTEQPQAPILEANIVGAYHL